ncbi:nucleoplasmin-2 isoform X7 [Pan paniscus]|uniref:nucleoplasmin-2 isoform X7 n=1 Tax=Pan paniscus TaxID=9597 RepID=UPI0004F00D6F|nr:nucleoplasmin-2 isoform X6 [Pan paniscus]
MGWGGGARRPRRVRNWPGQLLTKGPGPASSASPGNWLELQIPSAPPRPTPRAAVEWGAAMRPLTALQLPGQPASLPGAMNLSSASSTEEKAVTTVLWGCELSQERRTWTFRPQLEGKQSCRLLLHTVSMVGVQLSPPVTFQLQAGSGPVFLSGQERYEASDLTWEEEEEEEGEEEEEEEEDDEDEDADVSLEESPVKQVKRLVPQKQASVAKKKKLEKEEEEIRPKPQPEPRSQDSRNEEPRLGGHGAKWAFPGLCCRHRVPLSSPFICV